MAYGQTLIVVACSWGVAPGFGDLGRWPKTPSVQASHYAHGE